LVSETKVRCLPYWELIFEDAFPGPGFTIEALNS